MTDWHDVQIIEDQETFNAVARPESIDPESYNYCLRMQQMFTGMKSSVAIQGMPGGTVWRVEDPDLVPYTLRPLIFQKCVFEPGEMILNLADSYGDVLPAGFTLPAAEASQLSSVLYLGKKIASSLDPGREGLSVRYGGYIPYTEWWRLVEGDLYKIADRAGIVPTVYMLTAGGESPLEVKIGVLGLARRTVNQLRWLVGMEKFAKQTTATGSNVVALAAALSTQSGTSWKKYAVLGGGSALALALAVLVIRRVKR